MLARPYVLHAARVRRCCTNRPARPSRRSSWPACRAEKKGERLVVLYKLPPEPLQSCLEKLAQCDLPNLWKPRPDQFFHLEALPCVGTGKLDLPKAREIAAARSVSPP